MLVRLMSSSSKFTTLAADLTQFNVAGAKVAVSDATRIVSLQSARIWHSANDLKLYHMRSLHHIGSMITNGRVSETMAWSPVNARFDYASSQLASNHQERNEAPDSAEHTGASPVYIVESDKVSYRL